MEELFTRTLQQLMERTNGPLSLRFFLQPAMAVILAIRAGLKDARQGRPPYFWTMLSIPAERHRLIHGGLEDVGKIFILASVLDVIYQLIVFRWFYPLQTLIVATTLAVIPYVLVRGPTTRIARRRDDPWRRST